MRLLHHAREMGIVGFFNVLLHYRLFKRIFEDMADAVTREKPDAVLLVDYPGFNLRMAKRCKALAIVLDKKTESCRPENSRQGTRPL